MNDDITALLEQADKWLNDIPLVRELVSALRRVSEERRIADGALDVAEKDYLDMQQRAEHAEAALQRAREEMAELMARAWQFDNKPHRLFSHLAKLAEQHAPESERAETKRLMDYAYEHIGEWDSRPKLASRDGGTDGRSYRRVKVEDLEKALCMAYEAGSDCGLHSAAITKQAMKPARSLLGLSDSDDAHD